MVVAIIGLSPSATVVVVAAECSKFGKRAKLDCLQTVPAWLDTFTIGLPINSISSALYLVVVVVFSSDVLSLSISLSLSSTRN